MLSTVIEHQNLELRLMNNLTKALSYLISAQFQALGLIFAAWWVGDWLNSNHPRDFSWYVVTFPVGILAIGQSFFLIIRQVMRMDKKNKKENP